MRRPVQLDLALTRQHRIAAVADAHANRALTVWKRGMGADFDASWAAIADTIVGITAAGQVAAATGATAYLAQVANADGITAATAGAVQASSFAGVDGSGRTLEGLLYGAVPAAKTAIAAGSGLQGAFLAGATYLAVMIHTAILDTGRSADLTAMTAKTYTDWVRVVSAGACSRCAILAGTYSAKVAFQRHPRCRCTTAPVTHEGKTLMASSRYASPADYFESLSKSEQDRVFTNAGADAIRAGADPVAVVNARRGAPGIGYSQRAVSPSTLPGRTLQRTVIGHGKDGQPILGYTTGEATTVRGAYARQQRAIGGQFHKVGTRYFTLKRIRLMPETLVGLSDDVELRQILLRDAGYLTYPTSGTTTEWVARRAEMIRADRATADAFYRDHGIRLG